MERLSRIGNSDNPGAEFQETQDKEPSDKATATKNDASLEILIDPHVLDIPEKVMESQIEKFRTRKRGFFMVGWVGLGWVFVRCSWRGKLKEKNVSCPYSEMNSPVAMTTLRKLDHHL